MSTTQQTINRSQMNRDAAIRRERSCTRSFGAMRSAAVYTSVLLIGLAITQIGCSKQSADRITFSKNPTPLPDPTQHIDLGGTAKSPVNSESLKRSD